MNLSDAEATVKFQLSSIEMSGTAVMHDCLTGEDETIEGSTNITIPAHGSAAYFVTGTRVERTRYQAEEAWMPLYQELKGLLTARTESSDQADCGGYVGWLGDDPDNYMEWRDIYSFEGGKYRCSVTYASGEARNMELYVNGELVHTFKSLNTGTWNNGWGSASTNITLQPGRNTIRLGNAKGFAPNIDCMNLRRTGVLDAIETPAAPAAPDIYYNLQGQRVKHPRRGIYITPKGKKRPA